MKISDRLLPLAAALLLTCVGGLSLLYYGHDPITSADYFSKMISQELQKGHHITVIIYDTPL